MKKTAKTHLAHGIEKTVNGEPEVSIRPVYLGKDKAVAEEHLKEFSEE